MVRKIDKKSGKDYKDIVKDLDQVYDDNDYLLPDPEPDITVYIEDVQQAIHDEILPLELAKKSVPIADIAIRNNVEEWVVQLIHEYIKEKIAQVNPVVIP